MAAKHGSLKKSRAKNVVEHKRAEEALCESDELYHQLFGSMGQATQICELVFDQDGKPIDNIILDVNPAYEKQTGISRDQVVGRRIKEILPIVEQVWLDRYCEVVRLGQSMHFEEYNAALEMWFDVYACPLKGNRFAAVFTNITERKRAEEKLRESEERFRAVQENSLDRFTILKPFYDDRGEIVDFTYIYQNAQAARTAGYRPEELVGRRMTEVWHTFRQTRFFAMYKRAVETGRETEFEDRYHSDGVDEWFSVRITPIPDGIAIATQIITERKRAEEEQRLSFERLGLALDAAKAGTWEWNLVTNENVWSEECWGLYGLVPHVCEPSYDAWRRIVDPEDREQAERALKEAAARGSEINIEFRVVDPDGKNRWLMSRGRPLRDLEGKAILYIGIIMDITERKRAEEALQESEERYRAFFENSIDAVLITMPDGSIEAANGEACRIFGMTEEEIKQADRAGVVDTSDPRFQFALEERARTGKFRGELSYRRKDGTIFPGEIATSIFKDRNGHVKTAMIIRDITERKRAEEAQREAEARAKVAEAVEVERQRLYDMLEELPVMVNLLTPDHHVPFGNRAYREKFGELDGRHCYEYCFGKSEPCDYCEAYCVLETGKPHHWEVTGEDGSVIDVYDYPFKDVDGSPLILEMCIDITERRRAEAELEKHRLHLENLVHERTRDLEEAKQQAELYLDLMSHDISNMHQIILAQLQLANEIIGDEGRLESGDKELIDTSIMNLERSAKLIDNVKSLQKLRANEFSSKPVDLDELLDDAVASYSNIPDKDVTIDYTPAHGHVVMVNPVIKEVFNNLLDNAVKHSGDPVKIGIVVSHGERKSRKYHIVAIEDNGPGIPDNKKEEVFHRLKRGQTKARGTGLGLYLVKTLVESFGGMVELEDRVKGDYSQGCRFNVYLPAVGGNNNSQ